jgi:hypothetical protein
MSNTKYGEYLKTLKFKNYEMGPYRQGIEMTSQFLGQKANIRYGCCWTAGKIGSGSDMPHVHDYDQVIMFLGSDQNDLSDLGAEVEMCLGEEREAKVFTNSTAVAIPKGMPHFPAAIHRLYKRMMFVEVNIAPEYKETEVKTDKPRAGYTGWKSPYAKYYFPLAFTRKGAWTYGQENQDDGGGHISFVHTQTAGIDFMAIYENIKKAPYRFGPGSDIVKPHAHPTTQVMCFLGTDTDDLNYFGAEVDICVGNEMEKHTFTSPTAVVMPSYLPHWPGGVMKVNKPILFLDIHPFGNDH